MLGIYINITETTYCCQF